MKKQYLLPILGICAIAMSTSCSDEDYRTNNFTHPGENTIFFNCQSKLNSDQVVWQKDSKLGFFCDEIDSKNAAIGVAEVSAGQTEGLFYTQLPWNKEKGEHSFYLYSPYNVANVSASSIMGAIGDVQSQTGTSNAHLSQNALTYASAKASVVDNQAIPMTFKHALAYLDFNCTSVSKYVGWNIKSIELSNTSESLLLTGDYAFDMTTSKFTLKSGYPKVLLRANASPALAAGVAFHGYVSVNPVNLSTQWDAKVIIEKAEEDDLLLSGKIIPGNLAAGNFTALNLALDQMTEQEAPSNVINLSALETANCYIAAIAGQEYRFKGTVMGNGQTTQPVTAPDGSTTILTSPGIVPTTITPKSAQILWQTEKELISGVKIKNNYVYFTTNGSDKTPLKEGNAVIAVYSQADCKGDILWSWHIWVTAADIKLEKYNIHADYQQYDNLIDPVLMDRHLGATSTGYWGLNNDNSAQGLYYEWGRKDPFPRINDASMKTTALQTTYTTKGESLGTAYAAVAANTNEVKWVYMSKAMVKEDIAKYPMCYIAAGNATWLEGAPADLWGNPVTSPTENNIGSKSIYDPCPPGYRVPHAYVWTGFTNTAIGGSTNGSVVLNLASGSKPDIALQGGATFSVGATPSYPNAGYMNSSNAVISAPGARMIVWSSGVSTEVNGYAGTMYDGSNNFFTPRAQSKSFGYPVRCMKIK